MLETGTVTEMEDLCAYADRPFAFVGRYLRRRALPHIVILLAVLGAVGFSVSTDYALKGVVDALSKGPEAGLIWGRSPSSSPSSPPTTCSGAWRASSAPSPSWA